jgi:hypothetical protein
MGIDKCIWTGFDSLLWAYASLMANASYRKRCPKCPVGHPVPLLRVIDRPGGPPEGEVYKAICEYQDRIHSLPFPVTAIEY